MWKSLVLGCVLTGTALGQNGPSSFDVANLREDVRGLVLRVNELTLRLEQLERENAELRQRDSASAKSVATVAQLNTAVADLNQNIRTAVATSKSETLQHVAEQMEKLARQTNAALDSLAKGASPRPATAVAPVSGVSPDSYPKEGIRYTVQKGDTLAEIARRLGAKQQDIINANQISDPSRIVVGQSLFVPGGK
jgi:LysM repeat protein